MHYRHRRSILAVVIATLASIVAVTAPNLLPSAQAESAGSPAGARRVAAGSIASGYVNSCAILTGGQVRCWGAADQGILALGLGAGTNGSLDIGDDEAPTSVGVVPLGTGRTATSISMRYEHICAVLDNGAVRCWGNGAEGVLGNASSAVIGDDEVPSGTVDLGGGHTAKSVAAGWHQTCAILDDDSVKCWGQNNSGQLGLGFAGQNIGDDETPAGSGTVDLGAPATAISSGRFHTCAILSGGAVKCWGVNNSGQLGTGDTENIGDNETPASMPAVDLGPGRTAVAIAAGYEHTCAVLDNGALRCWGLNNAGQLGLGTTDNVGDTESPASVATVALGAGRTAVNVTGGYDNTCAVLDNGDVRCWGSNHVAQLALGGEVPLQPGEVPDPVNPQTPPLGDNELPTTRPVVNMGQATQAVATGTFHSCALLVDRSLTCWGAGSNGRTGYGDENRRGDDESPADYPSVDLGGTIGAPVTTTTTTTSTTTTSTTTTSAPTTTAPTTTAPTTTAPPTTAPPTTAPPTTAPEPKDTRAPYLRMWRGSPVKVGADGRVCVFLTTDETAITAFAINIPGKGEYRSAVIGVSPTSPQFLCITLPKAARPTKATATTFTAAGLDRAVNIAFDQQRIVLTK